MDYKAILLLFDNHPSAGYAYKRMKLAAQEDGFDYTEKDKTDSGDIGRCVDEDADGDEDSEQEDDEQDDRRSSGIYGV